MRTLLLSLLVLLASAAFAQEAPNFVTYDHYLEEPGNLEISTQSTLGFQKRGLPFYWAPLLEFEYGVKGWWTTSLYLEGASQRKDSTVFTGFRWENRFKPLRAEHVINPILYFEFENINEASRIRKEIVGHAEPTSASLSELRGEKAREVEGKLILSSNVKGWTIAENFIVEKNLSADEGVEFGYAVGTYRSLASLASGTNCRLCRENFAVGVELYGGLGSTEAFGFKDTAHYLAPGLLWRIGGNSTLKIAPSIGLTPNSARVLLRVGYTFEVENFGHKIGRLFGVK